MSWEHAIARELKKRDNPVYYAWFSGEVTSPVQTTDEEGHVNYSGPTIVSCFDGAVQLRADRLLGPSLTTPDSGLPCWGIPLPKSRAVRKF
mgnify:CR=1 FL=1